MELDGRRRHTAVRTRQSSAVRCRIAFESSFMVSRSLYCMLGRKIWPRIDDIEVERRVSRISKSIKITPPYGVV